MPILGTIASSRKSGGGAIPALGAWTTAGTTSPGSAGDAYYGWTNVGGSPRTFAFAGSRNTNNYYNNGQGGTWTAATNRPVGQGLGSSSKSLTNSNLFYTYGGDTGDQKLVYSTSDGSSWTAQSNVSYDAGWSDGTYFEQSGSSYLIAVAEYPTGVSAARAAVAGGGSLTWTNITSYPVYAAAPRAARLTTKPIIMGGFTSTSLSARRTEVYSYNVASNNWTSETGLPFTPGGGYISGFSLTGTVDSRVYVANGTSIWARTDASGTWTSQTATPGNWSQGWGTVTAGNNYYVQVTSTANTYFQQLV